MSRLTSSIQGHEGYEENPYKDHLDNWTVGWGTLIENKPLAEFNVKTVGELLTILSSPSRHKQWFAEGIRQASQDAQHFLGNECFASLTHERQAVVIEMAYQLGLPRLSTFVRFRAALRDRNFQKARVEMLDSRWAQQTPRRAHTLADRMFVTT